MPFPYLEISQSGATSSNINEALVDYGLFIFQPQHVGEKGVKNYDSEDDASDSEDDDEIFESDVESDHDYFSSKRKKKTEPKDHLDHESYSWCLMNYTIGKLVLHNMQAFLPDVGFELTGLFSWPNITCPLFPLPFMAFAWANKTWFFILQYRVLD